MKTYLVNSAGYNLDKTEFLNFYNSIDLSCNSPTYFTKYNIDKKSYAYILYKENLFRNFLNTISNCKVIYFSSLEPTIEFSLEFLNSIVNILENHNILLEIWIGNWDEYYNTYINTVHPQISCVNWNRLVPYLSYNIYKNYPIKTQDFTKLFLNLNNKKRYHRCILIDSLAKHNLLEVGHVSWLSTQDSDTASYYNFEYFDDTKIILDTELVLSNYPSIDCNLYESSFINLFGEYTESEREIIDISEKTWLSILYEKVFLAVAAKNYYKTLSDLGFLLYDELFDYSFDSSDTIEERIDGVVENLIKVKDLNYSEEYSNLIDKIKYNKKHFLKLLQSEDPLLNKLYSYTVQDKETNLIISKFKYYKQRGLK
jgi:hypothetical protein